MAGAAAQSCRAASVLHSLCHYSHLLSHHTCPAAPEMYKIKGVCSASRAFLTHTNEDAVHRHVCVGRHQHACPRQRACLLAPLLQQEVEEGHQQGGLACRRGGARGALWW